MVTSRGAWMARRTRPASTASTVTSTSSPMSSDSPSFRCKISMACFQSAVTPGLAFVAMNPFSLKPDYAPVLAPGELKGPLCRLTRQDFLRCSESDISIPLTLFKVIQFSFLNSPRPYLAATALLTSKSTHIGFEAEGYHRVIILQRGHTDLVRKPGLPSPRETRMISMGNAPKQEEVCV